MTPNTIRRVLAIQSPKLADATTDLSQLDTLASNIKDHHHHVLTRQSQALTEARNCGEFVARARPIWQRLRACGRCKFRWDEWLLDHVGISRNTANNYLRIYVHFDKLEGLAPDKKSISSAIEYLRSLKGGGATQRVPARMLTVRVTDLLAMAAKHNIQDMIDPARLIAVLNDVLKAAHVRKTIKLDKV